MNTVEVSAAGLEPPPWADRCARFALKVLEMRHIRNWDLSLLLCDDLTIRRLNKKYRAVQAPTDVLAFPQQDTVGPRHEVPLEGLPEAARRAAGDVVISVETMRRNAGIRRIEEEEEVKRLVIHGILHLEGMDHPDGEAAMLEVQERLLEALQKERVF
jgi:probable rRNA maturation factor